ncbi:DUF3624 family protein [Alisedimentitalea sp. MJ-SS2]|uniref:DUF3624 family protein n=1 Tax=Aliisedimentitalea sp. MJ-SS2 TaxID=3049795 RepID=UPI00290F8CE2|nr:DUF3624 family protein [Alisedimentitalea sp. MJ-SS2]MDU8928856.1 DUF3624 family protein [Alisedimentitalea sp. MJ-SS2]
MGGYVARFQKFWDRKFGRCAKCMRLAFLSAVSGWGALGLAMALGLGSVVHAGLLVLSLGLTVLVVAHVATFAARQTRQVIRTSRGETVRIGAHAALPVAETVVKTMSRRQIIGLALRYAAVAGGATLGLTQRAQAACGDCAATFGAGYYDCITHFCNNVGQTCCPPGYPYLNHCDCICYDGTGFDCNSYSNCNYCG